MLRLLVAGLAATALAAGSAPASACSCQPPQPVTPQDGAAGVPRNAVVVVKTSEREEVGLLHAGDPVPVEVELSSPARDGVVSVLRPLELLEAGATYQVHIGGSVASSFTVGPAIDDQAPSFGGLRDLAVTRFRALDGCQSSCWSLEDGTNRILLEHAAVPDDVAYALYQVRTQDADAPFFERLVPRESWDDLREMTSDLCQPAESPPLEEDTTYCVRLTVFDQAGNPAGGEREVCGATDTCRFRDCPDVTADAVCEGTPAGDRGGCSAARGDAPVALVLLTLVALSRQRARVSARIRR